MPTFAVIDKATGVEITRYSAGGPTAASGYSLIDFDHAELPDEGTPTVNVERRWTKQEFMDRLGGAVINFILTAAKSSVDVEAWVKRLELTTPDPDGTSVSNTDPRTIAGLQSFEALLVANGVVEAGWADGVLHGE